MSSDLKEQAKKIIAKGKTLNDPELIKMGLDMLDAYTDIIEPTEVQSVKSPVSNAGKFDMEQFTMSKATSNVIDKMGKKQSIYIGPRENKYKDDGVEHKEIKTPFVEPTERARKSDIVTATCSICGKVEKVNKIFTTMKEVYRCDSCILKGKV
jgi:hypothetical protein